MAMGFSGSNGGIADYRILNYSELNKFILRYSIRLNNEEERKKEEGLIKELEDGD